jgi:hypothetical protein
LTNFRKLLKGMTREGNNFPRKRNLTIRAKLFINSQHFILKTEEAMNKFRNTASLLIIVSVIFFFIGCAKPPEAEQKAAQTAMEAAVAAGADKYAAAELDEAKKLKETADAQVNEKKYKEAKQAYIDAKAAFEKAGAAAEEGKKKAADEANAALAAVEESWKAVETAASKLGKKLKEQKAEWQTDAGAFVGNLKAAKDMVATDALAAKAKAEELKAMIEKWAGKFKLAPSPKQS